MTFHDLDESVPSARLRHVNQHGWKETAVPVCARQSGSSTQRRRRRVWRARRGMLIYTDRARERKAKETDRKEFWWPKGSLRLHKNCTDHKKADRREKSEEYQSTITTEQPIYSDLMLRGRSRSHKIMKNMQHTNTLLELSELLKLKE